MKVPGGRSFRMLLSASKQNHYCQRTKLQALFFLEALTLFHKQYHRISQRPPPSIRDSWLVIHRHAVPALLIPDVQPYSFIACMFVVYCLNYLKQKIERLLRVRNRGSTTLNCPAMCVRACVRACACLILIFCFYHIVLPDGKGFGFVSCFRSTKPYRQKIIAILLQAIGMLSCVIPLAT